MKYKKVICLILCICFLMVPIEYQVSAATNPYGQWQTISGVTTIRCTYYAWQQAYNNTGVALPNFGNAINWYNGAKNAGYSTGTTAKAKSIAVWSTVNGYGHVGYVVSVNGSKMTVNEAGLTNAQGTAPLNGNGINNGGVYNNIVGESKYSGSSTILVGFIYLTEENSSNISITSYPSKNTITDTNAILWARVDKPSDYEVTKIGIRVRKDGDTYSNGWSRYDTPSSNYVGHAYMYPYYDLNEELNATLTHATKYWLQFYAVVDGTEYWSNEEWFITTGSHSYYGGYEAEHPHKYYQKCACGYYYYTGETASLSDCSYCYPILTITFNVNGGYINDSKSSTFHTDSDEFIFLNSNNSKYTLCWKYGSEPDLNGLIDDTTFGLERDGCNFLGWSLSPNGGIVYDKTIPYAPEDIYPDIVNGNATVNLYAVWEAYEHSYTYSWETMPTETENGIFIKLCKNCNSKTEYSIPNIKIDSIIFANNKIECKVLKPDIDPELSYMLATPYCVDGEGVATGFSEDDKYIIHTFENISALTSASEIEIELWFGAGEIPYSCAVLETRKYTFEQICNDISGDSNINAIDMVMLRVKLLGELDLSTGDTNADGMVDARDLVHLKKYISNY